MSKQFIIDYFEEIRLKGISESKKTDKKKSTREDAKMTTFLFTFIRVQGILYTKIGTDEIEDFQKEMIKNLNQYLCQLDTETNKSSELVKMVNVVAILIFIAHVCISNASKEMPQSQDMQQIGSDNSMLKQVLSMQMP